MASAVEIAKSMSQDQADEVVAVMSSKTALRKAFDMTNMDLTGVERIRRKLDEYQGELEARAEEERSKERAIEENRDKAQEFLRKLGLSPEDLLKKKGRGPAKGARPRAIYKVEDESGNEKEIEAAIAGKPPKALAEYMARTGKSREECMLREV